MVFKRCYALHFTVAPWTKFSGKVNAVVLHVVSISSWLQKPQQTQGIPILTIPGLFSHLGNRIHCMYSRLLCVQHKVSKGQHLHRSDNSYSVPAKEASCISYVVWYSKLQIITTLCQCSRTYFTPVSRRTLNGNKIVTISLFWNCTNSCSFQ